MTFNILQPTFKLLWEVNFSGNILFSLTTIWHLCPGLNASVFLVSTSCMKEFFTIFTALHIWQNYVCSVELLSMRTLNHACVKEPEILDISAIWRQLKFLFCLEFSSSPSDGAPQYFPQFKKIFSFEDNIFTSFNVFWFGSIVKIDDISELKRHADFTVKI